MRAAPAAKTPVTASLLIHLFDVALILHSTRCQRGIPIFPHRLIAQPANQLGDFLGRPSVRDVELAGGVEIRRGSPFAGAKFHNASALGVMNVFLAGPGVTAR